MVSDSSHFPWNTVDSVAASNFEYKVHWKLVEASRISVWLSPDSPTSPPSAYVPCGKNVLLESSSPPNERTNHKYLDFAVRN